MGRLVAGSASCSRPQHSGVVDEIAGGLLGTGWVSVKLRQGAVLTHVSTDVGKPTCQVLSLLEALAVFGENVQAQLTTIQSTHPVSLDGRECLGFLAHLHDVFIATRRALDITVGVSPILPWCSEVAAKLLLAALARTPRGSTATVEGADELAVLQVEALAAASAVEPIGGIGRIPLNHASASGARRDPHGLLVVLMAVVEVGACYVIIVAAFCAFPR